MLPLLPLGDLDLGVVGCSEPKVRVDDNFVHLQTKDRTGRNDRGRVILGPSARKITFSKFISLTKDKYVHSLSISYKVFALKQADSPGWCTADQSRKAG